VIQAQISIAGAWGWALKALEIVRNVRTISRPKFAKIGRGGQCSRKVAYEQVLVGRWRAKESVEVYQDLRGEFGSAGGMVDKETSIIRENEWVGS